MPDIGELNAITAEMRRQNPAPPQTEEDRQKILDGLREAEWMLGPGLKADVTCTVCGKRSPLRGMSKIYPFRPEAGGEFSAYVGSADATYFKLCPECFIQAVEFLNTLKGGKGCRQQDSV